MAYGVFRRFSSSNFVRKSSICSSFSSSSPISYLTSNHFIIPKDHSTLNPKFSSSFISSIFNYHNNSTSNYSTCSTPYYYRSIKKPYIDYSALKSPCESVRYFSSEPNKEVLDDDQLSEDDNPYANSLEYEKLLDQSRTFLSPHRKLLKQLPNEMKDITPEEFDKATEILLKSMCTLDSKYVLLVIGHVALAVVGFCSANCISGAAASYLGYKYFGVHMDEDTAQKNVEWLRKKQQEKGNNMHDLDLLQEFVKLLQGKQEKGNMQEYQTLVLHLLREVKESCDRVKRVRVLYCLSLLIGLGMYGFEVPMDLLDSIRTCLEELLKDLS